VIRFLRQVAQVVVPVIVPVLGVKLKSCSWENPADEQRGKLILVLGEDKIGDVPLERLLEEGVGQWTAPEIRSEPAAVRDVCKMRESQLEPREGAWHERRYQAAREPYRSGAVLVHERLRPRYRRVRRLAEPSPEHARVQAADSDIGWSAGAHEQVGDVRRIGADGEGVFGRRTPPHWKTSKTRGEDAGIDPNSRSTSIDPAERLVAEALRPVDYRWEQAVIKSEWA
jgi:hypothetical protein